MNEQFFYTGKGAAQSYAADSSNFLPDSFNPPKGSAAAFQSIANIGRTFVNHDTNISVKSDYSRTDYRYFRPSEDIPTDRQNIVGMCLKAYETAGIVRQIIDFMADFTTQGIRLQHPRKSTENFYNRWFIDKVNGKEVSSKFVIMLLKAGTVIISRSNGKVSVPEEKEWKTSIGESLHEHTDDDFKIVKREIPLKYTILNPTMIEVIGHGLCQFIGRHALALKVPYNFISNIKSASNSNDPELKREIQKMLNTIPSDFKNKLLKGARSIPLDMSKVQVFHYKGDDWCFWSMPILGSVLNDLIMLEKMKLADISALDGAISNIRLWRLGVLDGVNSILPTASAINKLRNILANNVGGGVLDLVWGPELDFKESNTQVWKFLGSDKYDVTINSIYQAFGIPPALRGGKSAGSEFVSMNAFIKSLQHIRDILKHFWFHEIELVHKAMGFKGPPPRIIFDHTVLADEAAEKQLLINLWDRDIISTESILEIFGRIPEVEKERIKIESSERDNGYGPPKASPYHNPDKEHDYKKIALQSGDVTPSEIGLELQERKEGEEPRLDKMQKAQKEMQEINNQAKVEQQRFKPSTSPGRPTNITETKKRKPKPTGKPQTNAEFLNTFIWATNALQIISEKTSQPLLKTFGKTNARQLTKEQVNRIEHINFSLLCSFLPFEEITDERIGDALAKSVRPSEYVADTYSALRKEFVNINDREPKIDELRQIFVSTYTLSTDF